MVVSQNLKNKKTVEVVALAMQFTEDGSYLLTRRGPQESGAGMWEFPGGKIEYGETQKQALVREIDEELGVSIPANALEFVGQNLHEYPNADILIFLWKLRVEKKPELSLVDHDMAEWCQPPKMLEMSLSPGDKPFISLL
jgi:mutator protein MutT